MVKVAIITYSAYGHITLLAREICKGLESNGVQATIFRVPETLCENALREMQAVDKPKDVPIITVEKLLEYDGYLFGISTRFGNISAQMSRFFEACGDYFETGELYHKLAAGFSATGTGAGKETAIRTLATFFTHQGMMYVPLGYSPAFEQLCNSSEEKGCSVWGAGSTAGADNSLIPTDLENEVAFIQGSEFAKVVLRSVRPPKAPAKSNLEKAITSSRSVKAESSDVTYLGSYKKTPSYRCYESELSQCCSIS